MTSLARARSFLLNPTEEASGRLGGLDGLRGLAMLMVIAVHLHLLAFAWAGLSSFFVLSGFLITRVLLNDRKNARSTGDYFKRFYIRRALRVFPIYYSYLLVLTVGVLTIGSLGRIRENLPAAWLYVYNFFLTEPAHQHSRMLDHLWSLSVEEQFYFLWPLVLLFTSRRVLPYLCLVLIGLGPLLRQWVALHWPLNLGFGVGDNLPLSIYVITTSQVDAFAFGALLNFVVFKPRAWHLWGLLLLMAVLGAVVNGPGLHDAVLGWPLFLPFGQQYIWGYTLVDLFWFLVICAITQGGGVKRFFSTEVLDYLGKRSYSTYIVHYPILSFTAPLWLKSQALLGETAGTLVFAAPFLAAVFFVANLSYRFIETPMLKLKDRFDTFRRPDAVP